MTHGGWDIVGKSEVDKIRRVLAEAQTELDTNIHSFEVLLHLQEHRPDHPIIPNLRTVVFRPVEASWSGFGLVKDHNDETEKWRSIYRGMRLANILLTRFLPQQHPEAICQQRRRSSKKLRQVLERSCSMKDWVIKTITGRIWSPLAFGTKRLIVRRVDGA